MAGMITGMHMTDHDVVTEGLVLIHGVIEAPLRAKSQILVGTSRTPATVTNPKPKYDSRSST